MNTVNFSNHSGYDRFGGTKTTAAELNDMFETMEHNELLMPTRLLTGNPIFFAPQFKVLSPNHILGYIPGADALSAIHKLAEKLKQRKPNLIYLLDRMSSNFFFLPVLFS